MLKRCFDTSPKPSVPPILSPLLMNNVFSVINTSSTQEELVSYTNQSCSVFWAKEIGNTTLPSSITGRLGGLSQRRLSSSNTTAVVQAVWFLVYYIFLSSLIALKSALKGKLKFLLKFVYNDRTLTKIWMLKLADIQLESHLNILDTHNDIWSVIMI